MNTIKSKVLLVGTVLTLAIVAPFSASFADEHYHNRAEHDKVMNEFLTAIDATPEQRQQFEDHHKQYEAQVEPVREDLAKKKADLIQYLADPKSTKDEALKKEADIDKLSAEMGRLQVEHVFTKRAFIKPDQQEKANAFFQKQVSDWQQKHEHAHTHGDKTHQHTH